MNLFFVISFVLGIGFYYLMSGNSRRKREKRVDVFKRVKMSPSTRMLTRAVWRGDLSSVSQSLQEGADPHVKALKDSYNLVMHLVSAKAYHDYQLKFLGQSPKDEPNSDYLSVLLLLLKENVSPLLLSRLSFRQPIDIMIEFGYVDMVSACLDQGVDINHKNNQGQTLLMEAARYGHPQLVKLLLDRGADPDKTTNSIFDLLQKSHKNQELWACLEQETFIS